MSSPAWISRCVNYQVNLRAIAARDPRNPLEAFDETGAAGPSTLALLTGRLDRLRAFGVTQLHLMPPFEIGVAHRKGIGSPYAARDYLAVDAEHGTKDELVALMARARALGFTVILGLVPNHTSRDHVWTRTNPDYYMRAADGAPAFDLDWSDTAKLDYRNPALREAMFRVCDHWLSLGADGFRVDMAHFINDRSFWDECLPRLRARHADRELLFLAECYGTENNLDLFRRGFDAAYDDDLYKCWLYFFTRDRGGRSRRWESPDAARNGDFAPALAAYRRHGVAGAVREVVGRYLREQVHLPRPVHLARYTDNHDEGRGLYRFGADASRAMNSLVFLLPQTIPFLLCGQEFGALNRPSIHERFGLCDKGYAEERDGVWTPVPGIELEGSVFARTPAERAAWREFFQALIRLRLDHPALHRGALRWLSVGEEGAEAGHQVVAFAREHEGERLACLVNLGPEPRRLAHPPAAREVLHGGPETRALPGFGVVVARMV